MKNMNKRTKTILAIVGVLAVVVIATGVVITQVDTSALFGATVLAFNPSNPTIVKGNAINLSINGDCTFTSSNTAIVTLASSFGNDFATSYRATGVGLGDATVTATCSGVTASTTVKVIAGTGTPPPSTPTTAPISNSKNLTDTALQNSKNLTDTAIQNAKATATAGAIRNSK